MRKWPILIGPGFLLACCLASCIGNQLPCLPAPMLPPAAPQPKIVIEQVCSKIDDWAPGAQADAAAALAPVVSANPNAAHVVTEWGRLRDNASACVASQKTAPAHH